MALTTEQQTRNDVMAETQVVEAQREDSFRNRAVVITTALLGALSMLIPQNPDTAPVAKVKQQPSKEQITMYNAGLSLQRGNTHNQVEKAVETGTVTLAARK